MKCTIGDQDDDTEHHDNDDDIGGGAFTVEQGHGIGLGKTHLEAEQMWRM